MKRTLFLIFFCLIAGFTIGWCFNDLRHSPGAWAIANLVTENPITIIEEARQTHVAMVEHPERCNGQIGTVEFHWMWVERYDKVLEVLKEVENDRDSR